MSERAIAPAAKAPVPVSSQVPAGVLQRKCACGQHTMGGECGECGGCRKRSRTIQRRAIGGRTPRSAPPIVHEVLRSPGQPLDAETRSFFEPRFRRDFSDVRVHTDGKAAESARAISAAAYVVGRDIVFNGGGGLPGGNYGRQLLAHELTHVVQQGEGPHSYSSEIELGDSGDATEAEADAVEHAASGAASLNVHTASPPAVQRKIDESGDVTLGKFRFEMEEDQGKGKENVTITFSPDPKGPATESINLIQVAKTDIPWAQAHPDQVDIEHFTTEQADRVHETQTGETLESISIKHYGFPVKASTIAAANKALLPSLDTKSPLASGLRLTIPEAVEGGFHVDVRPDLDPNMHPRWSKDDAPVSPAYPPAVIRSQSQASVVDTSTGLTRSIGASLSRAPGHNRPGDLRDAVITDLPGGGYRSSHYKFETVAHSDDLGINYGAVRWEFFYGGPGSKPLYSQERCKFSASVSDTFSASLVAFNKFYMNKHIVQKGETLKSISTLYFGNDSATTSIYQLNKDVLKNGDADAAIPVGTSLEMPGQGRSWRRAQHFGEAAAGKTP